MAGLLGLCVDGTPGTWRVLPGHLSKQQLMTSGVAATPWRAVTTGTEFIIIT